MGKKRQNRADNSSSTAKAKVEAGDAAAASLSVTTATSRTRSSLFQFLYAERQGIYWVLGCSLIGAILGFGIGTGHFTRAASQPVNPWRKKLGRSIRASSAYRLLSLRTKPWTPVLKLWELSVTLATARKNLMGDPANPRNYEILVEAILREPGGYVHPDLGMMIPAPSGAARGLGMVHDSFTKCQADCAENQTDFVQEEILIQVPLSYQMTRMTALDTLLPLIPSDSQQRESLRELDDAALLVLLLAHERAVSRASRWMPYIASLPTEPSCGYSTNLRPYMLDAIAVLGGELGVDVNGWPRELNKASNYADKIASSLARDYGSYIKALDGISVYDNLLWALCQVASRATAGSDIYGSLRLIPLMDMINHDVNAGGFVELTGREKIEDGDFVNADIEQSGMFVVRSLRHGRRKPLKKGQELMVNYNVPAYSPLDWFISLGFVPPERWYQWQKVDSALPKVRQDGVFPSKTRFADTGRHATGDSEM